MKFTSSIVVTALGIAATSPTLLAAPLSPIIGSPNLDADLVARGSLPRAAASSPAIQKRAIKSARSGVWLIFEHALTSIAARNARRQLGSTSNGLPSIGSALGLGNLGTSATCNDQLAAVQGLLAGLGLSNALTGASSGNGLVNSAVGTTGSTTKGVLDSAGNLVSGLPVVGQPLAGVTKTLATTAGSGVDAVGGLLGGVTGTVDSLLDGTLNTVDGLLSPLLKSVPVVGAPLSSTVSGVTGTVKGVTDGLLGGAQSAKTNAAAAPLGLNALSTSTPPTTPVNGVAATAQQATSDPLAALQAALAGLGISTDQLQSLVKGLSAPTASTPIASLSQPLRLKASNNDDADDDGDDASSAAADISEPAISQASALNPVLPLDSIAPLGAAAPGGLPKAFVDQGGLSASASATSSSWATPSSTYEPSSTATLAASSTAIWSSEAPTPTSTWTAEASSSSAIYSSSEASAPTSTWSSVAEAQPTSTSTWTTSTTSQAQPTPTSTSSSAPAPSSSAGTESEASQSDLQRRENADSSAVLEDWQQIWDDSDGNPTDYTPPAQQSSPSLNTDALGNIA